MPASRLLLASVTMAMRIPATITGSASGNWLLGGLGNLPGLGALTSTVNTEATSTAGGAEASGDNSNQSEERLDDPNQDGSTGDQAQTSGGSINFAGAVAVTTNAKSAKDEKKADAKPADKKADEKKADAKPAKDSKPKKKAAKAEEGFNPFAAILGN